MKLEEIVGLEVVTGDGRLVGAVEGVGIDVQSWNVPALKVGLIKGYEDHFGVKKPRFGSTSLFIKAEGIEGISDMVTLKAELKNAKEAAVVNEKELPTAGNIVGTRVVARGGRHIGYVDNFIFVPDRDWIITCMLVKLDKAVISDLGMKKPRLGTPTIKVLTDDIRTVGDIVMLSIDVQGLKDHLEKKPRKKPPQKVEEPSEEPMDVDGSSTLPFQVNDDYRPKYPEKNRGKERL